MLNWLHQESVLATPVKPSWLKEEQKVLATLPDEAVKSKLAWKPRSTTQIRLHTLVYVLLDTGLRI